MPRAAAAAISAVLDDDDLLGEILLRLAFPTSLVRAALVCKRWLRLASAPAFLRHFRDLHPPHLLGFYAVTTYTEPPRFVPIPQPPELAAVVRRASYDLKTMEDSDRLDVDYCWNGLLFTTFGRHHGEFAFYKRRVHCPLHPTRYTPTLPPFRETSIHDSVTYYTGVEILPNVRSSSSSDDGMPYFCLATGCNKAQQQSVFDVYVLQDDTWTWAIYSSLGITEKIELLLPSTLISDDDRIYNLVRVGSTLKLFSLDLSSSCLSLVNLPEEEMQMLRTDLSLQNDYSKVHLINVKGSQLRIWLYYPVDNDGTVNNWLLVDTICLLGVCDDHMIPASIFEDVRKRSDPGLVVYVVGVNSGLFFLDRDDVLYLFDIKRKSAKKVFEVTQEGTHLHQIRPFMMVWPPKFPAVKEVSCDTKE